MPRTTIPPEQLETASKLFKDGANVAEVQRQTGISRPTLGKYFGEEYGFGGKRKSDAKPSGQKRKGSPSDEQLTNLFAKVASAPAIPMGLLVHCEFCAEHFADNGPAAAAKLVELSHDHVALRSVMENLWQYADEIAWAGVLATWLGIPVAHHLAPDFIYKWIQYPLHLPPKETVAEGNGRVQHEHMPPNPFENLDINELMRAAAAMGIQIPPEMAAAMSPENVEQPVTENVSDTETTESPNSDPQAVADETVAADSDASE